MLGLPRALQQHFVKLTFVFAGSPCSKQACNDVAMGLFGQMAQTTTSTSRKKQAVLDSVAVEKQAVIDAESRQLLKLQQEQLAFIKDICGSLPDSSPSPKKPPGAPGKENNSSEASSVSVKKPQKSTSPVPMQVGRVSRLSGVAQGQSSGFYAAPAGTPSGFGTAPQGQSSGGQFLCAPSTGGGFWDSGTSAGGEILSNT
jgi:hypothetical protein